MKNKKISVSISIDQKTIKILNKITNRSKFIKNCILEEICKNKEINEKLINYKIKL